MHGKNYDDADHSPWGKTIPCRECARTRLRKPGAGTTAGVCAHPGIGQPVPDFTLTDQTGQRVSLAYFRGKVVGVTFIYTAVRFDPVHDTPEVLAKMPVSGRPIRASWHFLTGTTAEVKANFEGNQFTAEQLGDFVQATRAR